MSILTVRENLIREMSDLNNRGIDCSNCTGVCCTDKSNSMKIGKEETEKIYHYLVEQKLWNSQLIQKMRQTIETYRLDHHLSTGQNSSLRKTYTCPLFQHKSLGCPLPTEIKPLGCLAFNPKMSHIKNGEDCGTNQETLMGSEIDDDLKKPIPNALLDFDKKEELLASDLIISESTNPYYNLALEDFLLRETKDGKRRLVLWRNRPSIVMGHFQNPWLECDLAGTKKAGLLFVRRASGGGTVYHDLGNLNFSFYSDNGFCNRSWSLNFVASALKEAGINLTINDRNDLLLKEFKVSGSAFKQVKNYGYHHGTLLIDAKLDHIKQLLGEHVSGIETKAVRSVSSRVINLKVENEVFDYDKAVECLSNHWKKSYPGKVTVLDDQTAMEKQAYFSSWSWIWGETPRFSFKKENKEISFHKGISKDGKKLSIPTECDSAFNPFFNY